MATDQVIMLPGAVMPPDLAFGPLIEALGPDVDARAKTLEIYRSDQPPADYGLAAEVAGLIAFADAAGFARFHLLGYSAGGAFALAAAADQAVAPRIRSLALLEPAWAGQQGLSSEERAARARVDRALASDDPVEVMRGFMRSQVAAGVELPPPPPGPPPTWMATRPAGIRAITAAFGAADLDLAALRRFERPVYLVYGGLSEPDFYERMAHRLSELFADVTLERYDERHHFDPPHRVEPARLAAALRRMWRAGDPEA